MYTLKHDYIGDRHVAKLYFSNYYSYKEKPLSIAERNFESKEDFKHWLQSNSLTFLSGTLDVFFKTSKMMSPYIFHRNFGGNVEQRNAWMSNYWKLEKIHGKYYETSSPWQKCQLIIKEIDVLRYAIPNDERFDRELIIAMAKDMIKCAKTILKTMEKEFQEVKRESLQEFEVQNIKLTQWN